MVTDATLGDAVDKAIDTSTPILTKYKDHVLEFEFPDAPEANRFLRFRLDPDFKRTVVS
jgi:hypothetical protein